MIYMSHPISFAPEKVKITVRVVKITHRPNLAIHLSGAENAPGRRKGTQETALSLHSEFAEWWLIVIRGERCEKCALGVRSMEFGVALTHSLALSRRARTHTSRSLRHGIFTQTVAVIGFRLYATGATRRPHRLLSRTKQQQQQRVIRFASLVT